MIDNTEEFTKFLEEQAREMLVEARSGEVSEKQVKAQVSVLNSNINVLRQKHANREWAWRIGQAKARTHKPKKK